MAVIEHIDTGEQFIVNENPAFSGGIWECGDRRFTDEQGEQYRVKSLNPVDLTDKFDRLWRAADAYTSSYISGLAVGLLTAGMFQQLPKAMAVVAWSSAIWDEYYRRKSLITENSTENLDFSEFGSIPHTVPELRDELGL
jgi:hypothetical protein